MSAIKNPPIFNPEEGDDYGNWKKDVEVWKLFTKEELYFIYLGTSDIHNLVFGASKVSEYTANAMVLILSHPSFMVVVIAYMIFKLNCRFLISLASVNIVCR